MDDKDIFSQIDKMVQSEHELRDSLQRGDADREQANQELRRLQGSLDQCWDLLRQRRARLEFDQDVDEAKVRPIDEVESYWA